MRGELLTRLAEESGGAALPFRSHGEDLRDSIGSLRGPWVRVSWGFPIAPWTTIWAAAERMSLLGLN